MRVPFPPREDNCVDTKRGPVHYVGEAVREALGTDDPGEVEKAIGADRKVAWSRVRERYLSLDRRAIPRKAFGEYVPAWFLERQAVGVPDSLNQYFVARSLLYGHRVALVDELAYSIDEELLKNNEDIAENLDSWILAPPHNMEELLRRALLYLPLEKAGLLFHLAPPPHEAMPRNQTGFIVPPPVTTDENLELYFKAYLEGQSQYFDPDWTNERDARLARLAAEMELATTSYELNRALRFFARWHESIDIYTSAYPSYRKGIQFLMRLSGQQLYVGAPNEDNSTLDALWNLPGFSERAWRKLTVEHLQDLRDDRVFTRWRSTLQTASAAYRSQAVDVAGQRDFTNFLSVMKSAEATLLKEARSFRRIDNVMGGARDFGVSVAMGAVGGGVGAELSGDLLKPAVIAGAGGVLASKLPALGRLVVDAAGGTDRTRAVERHFALFGS